VATLVDLPGPKVRTGPFPGAVVAAASGRPGAPPDLLHLVEVD
jgi:hypothetical protein